jgi:uncharacterized protein (TIRG00374 family)
VAGVIGAMLFAVTLYNIDIDETVASVRQLGSAILAILLPGTIWHLLRTWGWSVAFPEDARPVFTRLFRVRLAADAVGFFTIRGLAGDPLKVLLLYDRVKPQVTTAAVALERLAFAVMGILLAGLISMVAVTSLTLPKAWDTVFGLLAGGAVAVLLLVVALARYRSGDYIGRLVVAIDRRLGRRLEASRVIRFVLDVEDVLLDLLRGNRRRLLILVGLPVVCYALMAVEVWVVLWAVGTPLDAMDALVVETFARLASVGSAAIPGNLGVLEWSNASVVVALGLKGGGVLAFVRRLKSLIWAAIGLLLYPRIASQPRLDVRR